MNCGSARCNSACSPDWRSPRAAPDEPDESDDPDESGDPGNPDGPATPATPTLTPGDDTCPLLNPPLPFNGELISARVAISPPPWEKVQ